MKENLSLEWGVSLLADTLYVAITTEVVVVSVVMINGGKRVDKCHRTPPQWNNKVQPDRQ